MVLRGIKQKVVACTTYTKQSIFRRQFKDLIYARCIRFFTIEGIE